MKKVAASLAPPERAARGVAVAVAVCLAPLPALAQDADGLQEPENANVFLERSYVSPFMPTGKNLILEGHAAGHFWIRNSLTDPTWRREGGWKPFNVPVSMIFVVRIFDDFSSPVRTPSFILRPLYVQALHLKRARDAGGGSFRLIGIAGGGTHHSDGQAGCTFLGQARGGASNDECVVADAAVFARREANITDGSFSTNFLHLDLGVRWGRLDNNARLDEQLSLRLRGEVHPLDFVKGGIDEDFAAEYGQYMLGAAVEGERYYRSGIGRVELWNQVRFGGEKDDSDYAGHVEVSWLLHRAENVGFFARLHWGSDYYNIHFQNTETFFQLGLLWDPGRLDRFIRRRGE